MTPAQRSRRRWDRINRELADLTRKLKRYEALYGPLPDDPETEAE